MTFTDTVDATAAAAERAPTVWTPVCRRDDLEPLWGEAALVGGSQVALFVLPDRRIFAVDNADPATGAFVMSRGIVGSRAGRPTIASPLHKDVFDLESGACLSRPDDLRLRTWRVHEQDGVVSVAAARTLVAASHGTSSLAGRRAVAGLVAAVRDARPELTVLESFVDVQQPDVPGTLEAQDPGSDATIVPLLLSAGFHVHVDLAEAARNSTVDARVTAALGPDPRLVRVLARRLDEAGAATDADTHVVLAAAGSRDRGAVADCHAVGRALADMIGRPVTVAFVSAADPAVPAAVASARAAGARRVAVATYLLAPGYFADLVASAGGDIVTAPLLAADAPPPAELVTIVAERFDAAG